MANSYIYFINVSLIIRRYPESIVSNKQSILGGKGFFSGGNSVDSIVNVQAIYKIIRRVANSVIPGIPNVFLFKQWGSNLRGVVQEFSG